MKPVNHIQNGLAFIDQEIVKLEAPGDRRTVVCATLADVAIEHCKSIHMLIEKHLFASACSLVRPMFETGIRSIWFNRCASDDELNLFSEKDQISRANNMGKMVSDVEIAISAQGALQKIYDLVWSTMHSYTHGGLMQASKRLSNGTVTPDWTEAMEKEICQIIGTVMLVVYTELTRAAAAGDQYAQIQKLSELLEHAIVSANAS